MGNFKVRQEAPETLESKLPKGKGCFCRQSHLPLLAPGISTCRMGAAKGNKRDTLGT